MILKKTKPSFQMALSINIDKMILPTRVLTEIRIL